MSSGRRWWQRHPVAFFCLGELISLALFAAGGGMLSAADNRVPATQPLAGFGDALVGVGFVLMVVLLVWGLIKLGSYLFRSSRGGTNEKKQESAGKRSAPPRPSGQGRTAQATKSGQPRSRQSAGASRAARPRPQPGASTPTDRRVKILMLGDSGSGKTTMLASLYHCFVLGGSAGIRFATDDGANSRLLRLVAQIRDPREVLFTAGTRPAETKRWDFAVRVESGDQEATAFTLEYLDYPGGYVERRLGSVDSGGGDPPDPQFEQALASADVLMGVLDGEKISRLMSSTGDLGAILSIENLLNVLARAGQRNIHLVVTKWDLVRGPGGAFYSISDVRDMLDRESSAFRSFRQSPRLGSMRMIPVSALGLNGFVRADPAVAGGMAKVPGRPWQSWNVQVPFFCAVPDILQHDAAKLAGRMRGNLAQITMDILKMVGINVTLGVVSVNVTDVLARIWRYVHDMNQQGRVPTVLSDNAAISYVLNECYEHVAEFEQRFPDSQVWPGANA
jgi:hypothetical protein